MSFDQIRKSDSGSGNKQGLDHLNTFLNTGGKGSKTSFWDFARMGGWSWEMNCYLIRKAADRWGGPGSWCAPRLETISRNDLISLDYSTLLQFPRSVKFKCGIWNEIFVYLASLKCTNLAGHFLQSDLKWTEFIAQ